MTCRSDPRPRIHGWRRLGLDLVGLALTYAAAGLVVRLTVRDHLPGFSMLFYATPPPLIAAALLLAGLLSVLTGRRRLAGAALLVGALTGMLWWRTQWIRTPASSMDPGATLLRLMCWNVAGPYASWSRIRDVVAAEHPDLVVLLEAHAVPGTPFTLQQGALQELQLTRLEHGQMILSRWPVEKTDGGAERGRFRWGTLVVRHPAGAFRLSLADITSNPLQFRGSLLREWRQKTEGPADLPELIAGDFNTPYESVWFRDLRTTHTHAFVSSGNGLHVTWPWPCPLMALDHVWLRGFTATGAKIAFNPHSDHGYLAMDIWPAATGRGGIASHQ